MKGKPRVTTVKHWIPTPASRRRGKSTWPSSDWTVRSRFHIRESACPSAITIGRCSGALLPPALRARLLLLLRGALRLLAAHLAAAHHLEAHHLRLGPAVGARDVALLAL